MGSNPMSRCSRTDTMGPYAKRHGGQNMTIIAMMNGTELTAATHQWLRMTQLPATQTTAATPAMAKR